MRVLTLPVLMSMGMILVPAGVYAGCPCGGASAESYFNYSGPACFGPPGFCLAPGCCECPPSACDNAWAGYCQQKARWQAFWTRVGTPHPPRHGSCWVLPAPADADCPALVSETDPDNKQSPQPVSPASPAANPSRPPLPIPAPLPERSSRRVYFPWTR